MDPHEQVQLIPTKDELTNGYAGKDDTAISPSQGIIGRAQTSLDLPDAPAAVGYQAVVAGPATGYDAAQAGPAQGYDAAQAEAQTYDAAQGTAQQATAKLRTVQDDELVQEQLSRILSSDSPLLRRARASATDYSNERGIVNSTMAAQAGEAAMIDAVLPVAQADAAAYQVAAQDNQTYLNQIAMFNVNESNSMTQFNTSQTNTARSTNAGRQTEASIQNAGFDNAARQFLAAEQNQTSRFNASETNQQRSQFASEANQTSRFNAGQQNAAASHLATAQNTMSSDEFKAEVNAATARFEANNKAALRASEDARYTTQQFQVEFGNIMRDPNLTPAARTERVRMLEQMTRSSLDMTGRIGGLEFTDENGDPMSMGDYLDFTVEFKEDEESSNDSNGGNNGGNTGNSPYVNPVPEDAVGEAF